MSLLPSFLFGRTTTTSQELPNIFPFRYEAGNFARADISATYTKILTDTLERTHGLSRKQVFLLADNCVQSEATHGVVTLLVRAMVDETDLFLVYKKDVNVVRVATAEESSKIRQDYVKQGSSEAGVYISFRNYRRTQMLKIYADLEYCILASLHKNVNLAKAIQIKMHQLRGSVALADASVAIAQAKAMAQALGAGSDIFLDGEDSIVTATPNIEPTEKAISFLDSKRAFYLDLPISYISGTQTPGIGSTGEADMRAVERGLKQYFFSIIHPVLFALFGVDTTFESQDFRQISTALETLKAFDLVSEDNLSRESKQSIVAQMFGLDLKEEQKRIEKEEAELDNAGGTPPEEDVA